ncbi:SusD/RagB family nutrient-binding outer membrane lipoprotein [Spirosoma linguale]|uniref:Lipoprotein n=1 Tax=Spirosoma linguale (strain ATCC 33905 / DSM 74 / LMG 10896 / Claus 1) TaxID=504472 RepID=D2QH99_SPILD|nr:hypothetical protein Slin_0802 [Spirosoma linguale DSM 74]
MRIIFYKSFFLLLTLLVLNGCKSFDSLEPNPNVASEDNIVPPSLLLGRITYDIYSGGGNVDGRPGRVYEGPWDQVMRWNQYIVSNNLYYGGKNAYDWTVSATPYSTLKNVNKMDELAQKTLGTKTNGYSALAKFFRAYIFVWMTQRVGDIPVSEAGLGLDNLTPKYDSQKDVYRQSLQLLEEANADLTTVIAANSAGTYNIDGDILLGNNLTKWQKVVNTFKLRVLVSLSKRADDTADLGIKQKFADVLANPTKYPIMTSNADNMVFTFNAAYDNYPHTPKDGNNNYQNVGSTLLALTTTTQDPRTFVFATPAKAELAKGKKVDDFSAYVGADISLSIDDLAKNASADKYSFFNYNRYYTSYVGPEPYIIIGYPELMFNIAEGLNRGWSTTASANTYYLRGINASLSFFGVTDGQAYTIGDLGGKTLGTTTVSTAKFLADPGVAYKGDNADGLEQILNQKYVAFFQNSGWEALYNWRRTGFPKSFVTTGAGLNAANKLPRRWQYPVDESTFNPVNYKSAITSQFGGTDDLNMDTWALK